MEHYFFLEVLMYVRSFNPLHYCYYQHYYYYYNYTQVAGTYVKWA